MPHKPFQITLIGIWISIISLIQFSIWGRALDLTDGGDIIIDSTGKDLGRLLMSMLVLAVLIFLIYFIVNFFRFKLFAIKLGRIILMMLIIISVINLSIIMIKQYRFAVIIMAIIASVPTVLSFIYLMRREILDLAKQFEDYYLTRKKLTSRNLY